MKLHYVNKFLSLIHQIITMSVKNNEGLEELIKAVDESRIEYEK